MQNQVRIIGGKWRGHKISFPNIAGVRPTPDRIRETLFNWLAKDIVKADCLELFAGSGAIGFEALSRGANSVVAIDQHSAVTESLTQNKQKLAAENFEVVQACVPSEISMLVGRSFSFIAIDPPYHQHLIKPTIHWINQHQLARDNALLFIECETGLELASSLPAGWTLLKQKRTKTIAYSLLFVGQG